MPRASRTDIRQDHIFRPTKWPVQIQAIDPGGTFGRSDIGYFETGRIDILACVAGTIQSSDVARTADLIVAERPTIYPGQPAGKANDQITLAIRLGVLTGHTAAPTYYVEPRTWKGQVGKLMHHRRFISRLSREQFDAVPGLDLYWNFIQQDCCTEDAVRRHPTSNAIDSLALAFWTVFRIRDGLSLGRTL